MTGKEIASALVAKPVTPGRIRKAKRLLCDTPHSTGRRLDAARVQAFLDCVATHDGKATVEVIQRAFKAKP